MEHVVVTGGLGFIGTHLAGEYLRRGHEVTVIDSLVTSVTDGQELARHPRCIVVPMSIEDYLAEHTFEGADRVIHAASLVGPVSILAHSGRLGAEIVNSTTTVVEAALHADVPLCVFSSAEIYGRSGSLSERDQIHVSADYNIRSEYQLGKLLAEAITINSLSRGLRAVVVRPFNVTGPGQSSAGGYVVPTFVQQALAGRNLTVFAGGEQQRSFLAVSDLVSFVCDYMDPALSNGTSRIFNIGNPDNNVTVNDLAELVKRLAGSDSRIIHVDAKTVHGPLYEEAASFSKRPETEPARALGWKPTTTLTELIEDTISYYRREPDWRMAQVAG